MAKAIGTLGVVDTITIGGYTFSNLTGLITLSGLTAASNKTTLRKCGAHAAAGYAVTAGKTLSIYAMRVQPNAADADTAAVAQSSNDVGISQSTSLSNPVYFGSESSTEMLMFSFSGANQGTITEISGGPLGSVTATNYLTIVAGSTIAAMYWAYGYEA